MSIPHPPSQPLVDTNPRPLGPFTVGPMAIGTWRLTEPGHAVGQALIETGLEHGFNLIDSADVYGLDWGGAGFGAAEEHVGRVLAVEPGLRDQIVLATKGGIVPGTPYNSSDAYLQGAVDASLQRLRTDRIDLYQIHRPDLFTSPAAVAATMIKLREQGKVVEFGVSNFAPAQFTALQQHLPFPLLSTQPQFSAAFLEPLFDGTFDQAISVGVVPLAWSPLAGGSLMTGHSDDGGVRPELMTVIDELAQREGSDRAGIALAFVVAHPARPVAILGTTKPSRVTEAAAVAAIRLDRADCYRIIEASTGQRLP